ncbi:hypothetical protein PEAC54167_02585 [Pediococcus acidilactici]|jgi:hypothetical protein|nr:hypothetical protein S100424_00852 [Pediococcus acidilactici]ARW26323.1 hypothetical protein S100313_00887 [Pediococcus acidilactici]ARW28407.1 hypothetical protein S101189_00852 [Pediococcus acidilactici]OBR26056.1 hypothetical protein SRCM100320_01848 [Pediococcus acidilactici]
MKIKLLMSLLVVAALMLFVAHPVGTLVTAVLALFLLS